MRAIVGIVGLVIVLAIVMFNAKHASQAASATLPSGAGNAAAASTPRAQTEAVRGQVQGLVDQAAQRASDAAAP